MIPIHCHWTPRSFRSNCSWLRVHFLWGAQEDIAFFKLYNVGLQCRLYIIGKSHWWHSHTSGQMGFGWDDFQWKLFSRNRSVKGLQRKAFIEMVSTSTCATLSGSTSGFWILLNSFQVGLLWVKWAQKISNGTFLWFHWSRKFIEFTKLNLVQRLRVKIQ